MLKDVPYNLNFADTESWRQQLAAIYEDPDMTDQFITTVTENKST